MANVPSNAIPAPIVQFDRGFHGELPAHLLPPGASPELRNVLCGNGEVVAQAGFAKVADHAPNGKRIIHIAQIFRDPFSEGDPVIIVEKDEVNVWLPDADGGAGAFQDITVAPAAAVPYRASNSARPTSTLDHDGNWILATGRGVYWWPLTGYDAIGLNPAVYTKNPSGGNPYIHLKNLTGTAFTLMFLPGLNDERVLISEAWVASHFEPHVMLGRIKQDDTWYVNRYAWSDTNSSTRWFPGFDDDEGITSVAGFADLPADVSHETPQILAIEQLRDLVIIYTDWNIWTLQFVGAPLMWVRRMVQGECGLAASGTVVNCGDRHYFFGRDGRFYEFNGTDKQPIGKAVEDYVNKNIAGEGSIFGFRRLMPDSCVWAFSTDADNPSVPDTAVAFNRQDGSWTIEDFPFTAARTVDSSAIAGPIGTATSIDELTGTIDALTGAIDDLSTDAYFRDTTSNRLNAEVMGSDDGFLYYRAGWTNDGADREHLWRSGILDFGEPLRSKHLSNIEVVMRKDGLMNQGVDVPAGNYAITIKAYAASRRERVFVDPTQTQTQTYRPGTDDDDCLWFRVSDRFMAFEVTSTSTSTQAMPWALSRLTPYLIPRGLR